MEREQRVMSRRIRRRDLLKLAGGAAGVAVVSPALLAACTVAPSSQGPAATGQPTSVKPAGYRKDVLNIAAIQELNTFDPHLVTSGGELLVKENIYETLVGVNPQTGELIPYLATSWDISPDGKTYTFKLRQGVKFHDGTPFNADAVKYNFERIAAVKGSPVELYDRLDGVQVVDQYTAKVVLKEVVGPWLSMLVINPKFVSPTAVKANEKGGDWGKAWAAENEAGTGPYMAKRWDRGRDMYWVRFDDYWRGWQGEHLNEVHNLILPEASTQRLMLEKGDLDVAQNISLDSLAALRANRDIQVTDHDFPNPLYFRLNYVAGPTKDLRVRKALSQAFDFAAWRKTLGYDAQRINSPVPMVAFGSGYQPPSIPYNEYSLDRAKQLLGEAGYPNGFEMTYHADPTLPLAKVLGEFTQAQYAKVGVKLNIVLEPFANILSRGADVAAQRDPARAMGSHMLYTSLLYPDPSATLVRMYASAPQGVRNLLQYENAKVTSSISQALRQADRKKALDLYWQANLQVIEDAPDILLNNAREFIPARKWVRGYTPHAMWPWFWSFYSISKE